MAREYFCAYHSLQQILTPFGDAECGRLFRAALKYSETGEEEEFSGNERFIWPTLRAQIDRDKKAYAESCATNRENGQKGGRPKKPTGFSENRTVFSETEKTQGEGEGKEKEKGEEYSPPIIPPLTDSEDCTAPQSAAVLTFILNDGSEFPITQEYMDQMQKLFPAVDVAQQFRSMAAWLINNPKKRKTRRGVTAFVNNWLSREQDRGARYRSPSGKTAADLQESYRMMESWANGQN